MSEPLLEVESLVTEYPGRRSMMGRARPPLRAVDRVSLSIAPGEIFGLVGESGCGKSTLSRTVLGVQTETAGTIRLDGRVVSGLGPRAAREARKAIQYVHQDPGAALDPWWSIGATLDEGLRAAGLASADERRERILTMLAAVGIDSTMLRRYPHELSGGQLRRIGIARILALHPRIVILDEPTSGLDLSVKATVLQLLRDLRDRFGIAYLLISHDLSVVERLSERVAIMYLGRIVETAPTAELFRAPVHPYTRALLEASPRLAPGQIAQAPELVGDPPSIAAMPSGCCFRTRCPIAVPACAAAVPALEPRAGGHRVACIRAAQASWGGGASPPL